MGKQADRLRLTSDETVLVRRSLSYPRSTSDAPPPARVDERVVISSGGEGDDDELLRADLHQGEGRNRSACSMHAWE